MNKIVPMCLAAGCLLVAWPGALGAEPSTGTAEPQAASIDSSASTGASGSAASVTVIHPPSNGTSASVTVSTSSSGQPGAEAKAEMKRKIAAAQKRAEAAQAALQSKQDQLRKVAEQLRRVAESAQSPNAPARAGVQRQLEEAQRQVVKAQAEVRAAKEQAGRVQHDTLQQLRQAIAAQRAMSLAQADGGRYGMTGFRAGGGGGLGDYVFVNGGGVGVSTAPVAQPIIVTTDPLSASASADLSEDLTIMRQILAKAVRKVSGPDSPGNVLGINIWTSRKDSLPASLYLEGYGVLFQFQVGFPLLPPPAKPETKNKKSPEDTTWDKTRIELFGQAMPGGNMSGGGVGSEQSRYGVPSARYGTVGVSGPSNPEPRYIRDRVEALKAEVLGALKEASHIRHLKPDQNIVVVVRGGPTAAFTEAIAKSPNKYHMDLRMMIRYGLIKGVHIAPNGEIVGNTNALAESLQHALSPQTATRIPTISTLTISVTKADANAFAKGSLKFDQFRKKAKIALY